MEQMTNHINLFPELLEKTWRVNSPAAQEVCNQAGACIPHNNHMYHGGSQEVPANESIAINPPVSTPPNMKKIHPGFEVTLHVHHPLGQSMLMMAELKKNLMMS